MTVYTLQKNDVAKYTVAINITGDWVSARSPEYPAYSASRMAGRFNQDGDVAYYLASGDATMKAEVPNWSERDIYRVAPTSIHAFNLAAWSQDHGCYADFLKSKADGGHGVCQQITNQLTGVYGMSGILYNSQPRYEAGQTGYCLVVLPPSGKLVDETFFVRDLSEAV